MDQHTRKRQWLGRGKLRDVVIVLSVVSVYAYTPSTSVLFASFAILAAGCLLHILVKGQLIRNVTLCTEGAYSAVRNPYYLANYLIDVSFCLLSGNVYLVLLYPFLFFWAYGLTFQEEEARLAALHGEVFETYRASVPLVFPNAHAFAALRGIGKGFSWRRVTSGEIKRIMRFGFVGTFLALLQRVGPEGLKEIVAGINPLDGSGKVLLAICAAFLLASVFIPNRDQ